jgi:hypothetical protein
MTVMPPADLANESVLPFGAPLPVPTGVFVPALVVSPTRRRHLSTLPEKVTTTSPYDPAGMFAI